ncbi:MAG: hypothetical protein MI920_08175 [Kiloniellales bacterium]|nr:hypothetical protein [Kiloniellales bacterium]
MSELVPWFVVLGAIVAALANIAIWSGRGRRWKLFALALVAVFLPLSYLTVVDLLSRPKPVLVEWSPPISEETKVIAAKMEEDVAIYIWIDREGASDPRAYKLPWDEQMARELHEAQRTAEQEGGSVRVRLRQAAERIEGERMFYAEPQEAPPPKQMAAEN